MAAVAGGRVEVARPAPRARLQGDVAFADLLGRMGCTVVDGRDGLAVERDPRVPLRGVDVDMADISDLVPTLAVVAVTASTPTTISRRRVHPGQGERPPRRPRRRAGARPAPSWSRRARRPAHRRRRPLHGAVLGTHHDHRLAMAFGVLGTAVDGIEVNDPHVVAKSWPGYWTVRESIIGRMSSDLARWSVVTTPDRPTGGLQRCRGPGRDRVGHRRRRPVLLHGPGAHGPARSSG